MCVAQTVKQADLVSHPTRAAPLGECHHLLSDRQRLLEVTGCGIRLHAVEDQLEAVIVVLQAEQRRRMAGSVIQRPAWKNLVFAGAGGSGKSRAAAAVGRVYHEERRSCDATVGTTSSTGQRRMGLQAISGKADKCTSGR